MIVKDKQGREPSADVCLTKDEQETFYETVSSSLERMGESIDEHLRLAKEDLKEMTRIDKKDYFYG